jgi:DNA-binding transcriptional ArsR family regulator
MSARRRSGREPARRAPAPVFAALGDDTRLALVARLSDGQRHSITRLCEGSPLTRQAVTKHLRVLAGARLVRSIRCGRESLFELDPTPIRQVRTYLDSVSEQWDAALSRLRSLVERGDAGIAEPGPREPGA